jgi:hypothetical protein
MVSEHLPHSQKYSTVARVAEALFLGTAKSLPVLK